jgi:hypothetical protein
MPIAAGDEFEDTAGVTLDGLDVRCRNRDT